MKYEALFQEKEKIIAGMDPVDAMKARQQCEVWTAWQQEARAGSAQKETKMITLLDNGSGEILVSIDGDRATVVVAKLVGAELGLDITWGHDEQSDPTYVGAVILDRHQLQEFKERLAGAGLAVEVRTMVPYREA